MRWMTCFDKSPQMSWMTCFEMMSKGAEQIRFNHNITVMVSPTIHLIIIGNLLHLSYRPEILSIFILV